MGMGWGLFTLTEQPRCLPTEGLLPRECPCAAPPACPSWKWCEQLVLAALGGRPCATRDVSALCSEQLGRRTALSAGPAPVPHFMLFLRQMMLLQHYFNCWARPGLAGRGGEWGLAEVLFLSGWCS